MTTALKELSSHISRSSWKKALSDKSTTVDVERAELTVYASNFPSLEKAIEMIARTKEPWKYIPAEATEAFVLAVARSIGGKSTDTSKLDPTSGKTLDTTESPSSASQSAATQLSGERRIKKISELQVTPEQRLALKAMKERLEEVNGQDAYSVTATALGTLRRSEFLVLPEYYAYDTWVKEPAEVGAPWDPSNSKVAFLDFVNIYALNKAAGKEAKDAVFFALVRAEAVKMGWYQNQPEVRFEPVPDDAIETFITDSQAIDEALEYARTAAFLIPFMSEIVFRTTGHHYLTGLADEYERKYQALCSACLIPDLTRKLRASELWHWAMHWVSPQVTRASLEALLGTERLPNAIAIRANSAPAGTALVTTSSAVIEAMESCNWAGEVAKHGGYNFDRIKNATKAVKASVAKYHSAYFAYGVAPPTKAEKQALEDAIVEAQKFAPIAQGFIDAMYADSSLSRAKALKKHADSSPVLQRRALRVFRALAKADTEEISDIFKSTAADKTSSNVATDSAAKS